jgi:hypothetical protein
MPSNLQWAQGRAHGEAATRKGWSLPHALAMTSLLARSMLGAGFAQVVAMLNSYQVPRARKHASNFKLGVPSRLSV